MYDNLCWEEHFPNCLKALQCENRRQENCPRVHTSMIRAASFKQAVGIGPQNVHTDTLKLVYQREQTS